MTKKIMLTVSALALAAASFAQSTSSVNEPPMRARVGIKGGLNLSNISNYNNGSTDNNKTLAGWNAGVIVDLPLAPILSLQPGVFYTTKGTKIEGGSKGSVTDPYYKYTTNPSYIEVPVNFVAKLPLGDYTNKFFVGAGPYAAFGVAGKNKWTTNVGGAESSGSSTIKWDDDTPFNSGDPNQGYDKLKRFDWGLNFLTGFELNDFIISAQYGLGFNKIYSGTDDQRNDKSKNRVFTASVGWLF